MKGIPIAVWSVRWGNPYTSPPDGKKNILKEIRVPWGSDNDKTVPHEIKELADIHSGYVICWHAPEAKGKKWSKEALHRNRIKRIEKRAEKKFPLFKSEVIATDIAKYKQQGWL